MRSARNVGKLMTGTAIGQAASFAIVPVLSRLYSPDDFGVVGVFLSLASVLGVVAALRLELAVVVPREDDEARSIMGIALLAVAGVMLATLVAVILGGSALSVFLGVPALAPLLGVLPLYVASLGTFQVFSYWSTRTEAFGRLAAAQVSRAVSTGLGQAGLGVAGLGASGMLAGQVVGQVLATLTLLTRSARAGGGELNTRVNLSSAKVLLRRYNDFVVYGAPQALLNAAGQGLPAILLTSVFGASAAGQYLLAQRIVTAPGNLLGQSLRQVLYPYLSKRLDDQRVMRMAVTTTLWLAVVGGLPAAILGVYGPDIFSWAFGTHWHLAGQYARYTGLLLAAGFFNIPAVSLIPLLRVQRWHAGYEAVYMTFRIAALVVGGSVAGAVGAIAGMALTGFAFNLVLTVTVLARLKRYIADPAKR